MSDDNEQIRQRREKLAALRQDGFDFPNDFRPTHLAAGIAGEYGDWSAEKLEEEPVRVAIAGRMMSRRI
ncbi:MAG TPA: lysine--tRNA ligase, partial [Arenicellales bacterium]|nr:lysine--tRNA ligase [Arenicellales bacterium]